MFKDMDLLDALITFGSGSLQTALSDGYGLLRLRRGPTGHNGNLTVTYPFDPTPYVFSAEEDAARPWVKVGDILLDNISRCEYSKDDVRYKKVENRLLAVVIAFVVFLLFCMFYGRL